MDGSGVSVWGVEKAPVDCCWSFSKSSCSCLGSLGGEGEGVHEDWRAEAEANGRRRKPGRTWRVACMRDCICVVVGLMTVASTAGSSVWMYVERRSTRRLNFQGL